MSDQNSRPIVRDLTWILHPNRAPSLWMLVDDPETGEVWVQVPSSMEGTQEAKRIEGKKP